MTKQIGIIILILIGISSCKHQVKKENLSTNGIWESIGSGWVLQIKDSTAYHFYDITSISCLPKRSGKFEELQKSLTLKNDTLYLQKGVITYRFIRRDKLPELCISPFEEKKSRDPRYNFEVFAETVKEHYAFLELNKINWDDVYKHKKAN